MPFPPTYTIAFDATGKAPDVLIEGEWIRPRNSAPSVQKNDKFQVSVTVNGDAQESTEKYYSLRLLACPLNGSSDKLTDADTTAIDTKLLPTTTTSQNQALWKGITKASEPDTYDYFTDLVCSPANPVITKNGTVNLVTGMTMTFNPGSGITAKISDFELLLVFGDPHRGKAKVKCNMGYSP